MNATLAVVFIIGGPSIILALYGELSLKYIWLKYCKKQNGSGLILSLFVQAVPLYGDRVFFDIDQQVEDEEIKAKIQRLRLIRKLGLIGLALEFATLIIIVNSR